MRFCRHPDCKTEQPLVSDVQANRAPTPISQNMKLCVVISCCGKCAPRPLNGPKPGTTLKHGTQTPVFQTHARVNLCFLTVLPVKRLKFNDDTLLKTQKHDLSRFVSRFLRQSSMKCRFGVSKSAHKCANVHKSDKSKR